MIGEDPYKYTSSSSNSRKFVGHVHAQCDGTYEISTLGCSGNNDGDYGYYNRYYSQQNADAAFKLLLSVSHNTIEAIGVGKSLDASSLTRYGSDGVVQSQIDPTKPSEAILWRKNQEVILNGLQQLRQSDLEMVRVLEDLIQVLMQKGVINITDFPAAAQLKLINNEDETMF